MDNVDAVKSSGDRFIDLAAAIVSAYIVHNAIRVEELPALIASVHQALSATAGPAPAAPDMAAPQEPAVPIRRSVTPDFLISLEDGKRYKTLKRHLAKRGLSPDAYRSKWGLKPDYPMVAPNYSAVRSALAKTNGLGRKAAPPPGSTARKRRAGAKATAG